MKLKTQRTIGLGKCDEEIRIEIYVKFIFTHKSNHLKKTVGKVVSDLKMSHRLRRDEHSTERFRFYQTFVSHHFFQRVSFHNMGMIT